MYMSYVKLVCQSTSYDVILADGEEVIISKFLDFKAQIVFSAEGFCWPDKSLAVSTSLVLCALLNLIHLHHWVLVSLVKVPEGCSGEAIPLFGR